MRLLGKQKPAEKLETIIAKPMTTLESVFWGTVAGVTTAAFLAVLKLFFDKVLVPWFEDRRYKSVRLAAEWHGTFSNSDFDIVYRLTLKQTANRVSGVLRMDKKTKVAEPSEILDFAVEGSIWEGFLSITTKSVDDTRLAFGSDLFQIKEGGQKLEGIHLYRSLRRDCVGHIPLSLTRS